MRKAAWILLVCCVESCAGTYREYVCPDPIGRIVQDDCDVYRTRYESLKVDVGFSLGGVGVHAKTGQESLRDPSELIQLLEHQQLTLCRDFNSCRIAAPDYREKRDQADRVFTGVTAISEQLKNPSLEREDRTRLMSELLALLTTGKPTASAVAKPTAAPERAWRRPTDIASNPVIAPPRRPQVARGVPEVVGMGPGPGGLTLWLRGYAKEDIQEDDEIELVSPARVRCTVRRIASTGLGTARCEVGKQPPAGEYSVSYRPGVTSQPASLGVLSITSATEVDRAWVAFTPEPIDAPLPRAERPYLVVSNSVISTVGIYARCQIDGKPIGGALRSAGEKEALFSHRHHIPLPFTVRTGPGGEPITDPFDAARHAGRWTCTVSAEGNPSLEAAFTVTREGRVTGEALPDKDALRPPWWRAAFRRIP